jgi:hypothetical protein
MATVDHCLPVAGEMPGDGTDAAPDEMAVP